MRKDESKKDANASPLKFEESLHRILGRLVPTRGFLLMMGMVVPPDRQTRNICLASIGKRISVAPDGCLALLVGVPPKKLEGVYDLNPEIFGLAGCSTEWRAFLRVREAWDQNGISWEVAVERMVRCVPESFPRYEDGIPVSANHQSGE